jgi:hypothetical protein
MIKLTKLFLVAFILVLFANLVSSLPIVTINVNSNFSEGEIVKFSYTILSSQNEQIEYTASIKCLGSQEVLLDLEEANLVRDELFSGEYVYGLVDETVNGGDCFASISLLEPYNLKFEEEFSIINLLNLQITPVICKEKDCTTNTKVFNQGEKIYFDYICSIENTSIKGTLTFPDSSTQQINFPSSIKANKIGTYKLEITATKEGYNDANSEEQFAVIKNSADIPYTTEEEKSLISNLIKYIICSLLGLAVLIIIFNTIKKIKSKGK